MALAACSDSALDLDCLGMESTQFHRLFLENQRRVFGFVLTMLPRLADAEEVFQNACVVILSKAAEFQPGTDFAAWACQIARFEVFAYRRRQQAERQRFSGELVDLLADRRLSVEKRLQGVRQDLRTCIEQLRPEDRRLLEARYESDSASSSKQLAGRLGILENTLYKALGRIRRALRLCVERKLATEAHR